jgi:hypothetical protein
MNSTEKSNILDLKVKNKILVIRNQQVILDFELAKLYEVETRVLKQAVRRNSKRFPGDFMFILTKTEWKELITNCDNLINKVQFSPSLPFAFTEHGILMLASVLKSDRAIKVNIQIARTFIKLRQFASAHRELANKISQLEQAVKSNNNDIKLIFDAINSMLNFKSEKKPKIGFRTNNEN